jgi:hypothetical protein
LISNVVKKLTIVTEIKFLKDINNNDNIIIIIIIKVLQLFIQMSTLIRFKLTDLRYQHGLLLLLRKLNYSRDSSINLTA